MRRQNTDKRKATDFHPDGAPDDIWIAAEIPLPQSIPEDGNLRQIHLLIRGKKVPPEQRTHTQAIKEIGRRDGGEHLLRFIPGEIRQVRSVAHGRKPVEGSIAPPVVPEIQRRNSSSITL